MQHKIEFAAYKVFQSIIRFLPFKSVQRLGAGLGLASYYLVGSRRNVALDNLRHGYPEKTEGERRAIAKKSFMNYGSALFEFFWFPSLSESLLRGIFHEEDFALVRKVKEKGTGGVFLTGHLGNWELLAVASRMFGGIDFAVIVQTQSNKYFDEEINRCRSMFGNRVVPMGISIREIIRTLQAGGGVAVAGDQSGAKEAVYVDFFGRKVSTHQGPAVFALKCKVPLILGISLRRPDGTFHVEFSEIPMSDLDGYSDENVLELTRRHTALLEEVIRRQPEQWLWMHRRWKHTWESVQAELAASPGG